MDGNYSFGIHLADSLLVEAAPFTTDAISLDPESHQRSQTSDRKQTSILFNYPNSHSLETSVVWS